MMDDKPTEDFNETNQSTTGKQRSKKLPSNCKICGAPALYSYFGVVACGSCKIFFRRNAQIKQDYLKCFYDGYCEININNRHICTACRLAKCFASGMQVDMLRAPRTVKKNTNEKPPVTTISTISTTQEEKDQPQQLPTLNLLRSDQSTLTIDQWNLLSNLTHCFDEYSGFSLAQGFLRQQNELPPKMRFKLAAVTEFYTAFLGGGQLFYEKNADVISLCSHDRSILLGNTIKYVAGLGTCLIARYTRLLDNAALYKSSEAIYGSATLANTIRVIDQLDFDDTFVKLVLALLVFSTVDYVYHKNMAPENLINIKAVLVIQDMYTEVAWRYLLYRYDHERAVICFSNLMRCLFSVNDIIVEAVECKQYRDMIDSLVQKTEETFKLTE